MTEKKVKSILEAMEGITYLEWRKLKHCIDVCFNADASTVANKVLLADVDRIIENYNRRI